MLLLWRFAPILIASYIRDVDKNKSSLKKTDMQLHYVEAHIIHVFYRFEILTPA